MIKHTQTIFYEEAPGSPRGNCYQTVIASLMDLEIEDVPHFVQIDEDGGENWYEYSWRWSWERGYELKWHQSIPQEGYSLISGKSPRGNFYHVVIYKDGKFFHDPHPSQAGLLTEENFYTLNSKFTD